MKRYNRIVRTSDPVRPKKRQRVGWVKVLEGIKKTVKLTESAKIKL